MGNGGCSSYGYESVLTCIESKWMAMDVWIGDWVDEKEREMIKWWMVRWFNGWIEWVVE